MPLLWIVARKLEPARIGLSPMSVGVIELWRAEFGSISGAKRPSQEAKFVLMYCFVSFKDCDVSVTA
jgi:hypothetical protein